MDGRHEIAGSTPEMIFASAQYLIFLVVVYLIYWHLSRRQQNFFLLLASYFFYASWDWRFLSLIVISTVADFVCGARIHAARSPAARRAWLMGSLAVNLGVLGYFKYFNFFADSLVALANSVGWQLSSVTLSIVLPVGISFYTFQTMSYSLDIYRRQLEPTRSFIDFAAFVAFFPQLVAGPIVRAKEFMFQLEERRYFDGEDLESGLSRILFGLFKKTVIADNLGAYLVDPVFANPGDFASATLWLAMVGYGVQIYADFSGYSSIAIGSARILGFKIPENFRFPYLARNFSDFWGRWHISMSRFFRDYVYIPLGGNRHGTNRTIRNLAATTLISGLWHGANWTFVVWGALHGVFIGLNQLWRARRPSAGDRARQSGGPVSIASWFVTQLGVLVAWVVFRASDFSSAGLYLRGLIVSPGASSIEVPLVVWFAFAAFLVDHYCGWLEQERPQFGGHIPQFAKGLTYAAMIIFLYRMRPPEVNPFIYFIF